ncbi:MAG: alpha-mannosidase [Clostridia bacterium]|nr:alpha-mannosidase [Clostridia bacterium]
MIIPNVEERIEKVVSLLSGWRLVKKEFLPVLYTDEVVDKQVLPTCFSGWKTFDAPYTIYEQDKYFWFKASFTIKRQNHDQKAYFYLDTGIDPRFVSSTIRPQGLLYLNGKLIQGVDINHGDVLLEDGDYEAYLLFYSHTFIKQLTLDFSVRYEDEKISALYYDLSVAFQGLKLLALNSNERMESLAVIEKTLNLLDFRKPYSAEFYSSISLAREFFKENYYDKLCGSRYTVNLIGHTHIDVAWMWDLCQTKQKVERSFATVLKLMDEYPEYRFFMSQPQLFDFLKERNPELYARVKEKILQGRWEVDGSMWLEADCNLTSGESLTRQILFGKKFFKEEFNVDCKTVWLPDVFGYSASLPQIMKKSGVENFITAKIGWNDVNRMPYDAFIWRGIDGSEVFAYFLSTCECNPRAGVFDQTYTTYTAPINPMYVLGTWNRFQQKEYTDTVIMSYGWGDGGGGPTREDLEVQKRLEKGLPGIPNAKIESLNKSISTIKDNFFKNSKSLARVPTWNGELYFEYHRGTLTSVPRVKMNNRKGEFALLNAEFFGSIANILCKKDYPKTLLDENWKLLLLNQFHDILPGSSIADVYKDSREQFDIIFSQTAGVVDGGISTLSNAIKTDGGLMVFNPNGFTASGTVLVGGKTRIVEDIPALGYKVVNLSEQKTAVKVGDKVLENSYYKITFNQSGAITSLFDKTAKRELVKSGRVLNEFKCYQDTPYQYDNWEMTPYHFQNVWAVDSPAEFESIFDGDRAGFIIKKPYISSLITQKVFLYEDGIDRIDFVTDVDWKEKNQLLKVLFPFDLTADKARFDVQFGHVERAIHSNTSWDSARFESAGQKWVDLSENDYGVALLNDGKYGFGSLDGELSMTVLKSGGFPFDGASDDIPTFTYSILPHQGQGVNGGIVEKSYLLNRPLFGVEIAKNDGGILPAEFSAIDCQTKGVIFETLKLSESGDGYIARAYEAYKERKVVTLALPNAKRVAICDLSENEIENLTVNGGKVQFTIKPFEIITLKITL